MYVHGTRDSIFSSHSIAFGGALVRNDVVAVLDGEGGDCTLNGLYLADGWRLIDNHTTIDHAKPNCNSFELYKGVLDGKARGVFNGKIFVRQDAQKIDAKQSNKNLLLSDSATISRSSRYGWPTKSGPLCILISWSAKRPTAGPLTGKRAFSFEYSASTLTISHGMIARFHRDVLPPFSVYQGDGSVMTSSF